MSRLGIQNQPGAEQSPCRWQVQIQTCYLSEGDLSYGARLCVSTRTYIFNDFSKARACFVAESAEATRTRDWPGASCEVTWGEVAL